MCNCWFEIRESLLSQTAFQPPAFKQTSGSRVNDFHKKANQNLASCVTHEYHLWQRQRLSLLLGGIDLAQRPITKTVLESEKNVRNKLTKETAFFVRRTWHRRIGHCGSLVQEYPEAGYWLTTAAELTRRPHWSRGRFIGRLAVSISVKT
jgi:hypothetical protein